MVFLGDLIQRSTIALVPATEQILKSRGQETAHILSLITAQAPEMETRKDTDFTIVIIRPSTHALAKALLVQPVDAESLAGSLAIQTQVLLIVLQRLGSVSTVTTATVLPVMCRNGTSFITMETMLVPRSPRRVKRFWSKQIEPNLRNRPGVMPVTRLKASAHLCAGIS